jgi:hypothetical protein
MILRQHRLLRIRASEPTLAGPKSIFEADPEVAAERNGLHGNGKLTCPGSQQRPLVTLPKQPICRPFHVGDVLGSGPDAAEDAEHWLDEAPRCTGGRCRTRTGYRFRNRQRGLLDILESVSKDNITRRFKVVFAPSHA